MKYLLYLCFCFAIASPAESAPKTPFPTKVKGEMPPAYTVRLFVEENRSRSVGSGVLIAPDLVLTCNHVVNDRLNSKIEVLFPNWDVVIGDVIKVNGKHDVALIKLKEPREGHILLGPTPRFKDTLTIRGFGYGPYLRQTGTYIRDDADHRGGSAVIKGAQARLGDSGGGVEDKNSKLVGILWGASNGHTWFVRIDKIIKVFPQIVTASAVEPEEQPEEGDHTPYVIEDVKYSL